MKKLSYIGHYLHDAFKSDTHKFNVLYEFDLPSIVGDEESLQALADKNDLKFYYQIHESESPPVRRVMGKLIEFAGLEYSNDFLVNMDKAIDGGNYRMPRAKGHLSQSRNLSCSLISDSDNIIIMADKVGHWEGRTMVQGKFVRDQEFSISISDIMNYQTMAIPLHDKYIKLFRDNRDPDDVWTIQYYLPVIVTGLPGYKTEYIRRFERGAKHYLGITKVDRIINIL